MKSTLTILVFSCLIVLSLQSSFLCQIEGCQFCSFPNSCGQCSNNNLLQFNTSNGAFYCQPVTCPQNCGTCFINNTCQVCNSGYFLTQTGSCANTSSTNSSIPPNCLWGSNSQNCSLCAYGYKQLNGYCYEYISNVGSDKYCLIKLTSEICQICQSGYFVSPIGKCIANTINESSCNVGNCAYCNTANATCSVCMPGYQLTSSGTCTNNTCASTGCTGCSTTGQCSTCSVGYQLDSSSKTCKLVGYACNDPNCGVCSGPQSCGQCKPGYQLANYPTSSSNTVGICRPLNCPYNIANCQSCSFSYDSNFNYQNVLCTLCQSGFVLVNGYCVANLITPTCAVSNCLSCSYTNFCKSCALGYTLTSYGSCVPAQCNIPNCASCSVNFVCQQCKNGYSLALGSVALNANSASGFANTALIQCIPNSIPCNITNCAYCLSTNQCASCATGYDFSSSNSNTCVPTCTISNCLQCTQGNANTCAVCKPGYQSQSSGASCQAISFSCGSGCTNSSCIYNWVTSQAQCTACQNSMTLYNGACYPTTCNIYGCSLCANWASPVICLSCNQGLVMTNGYCTKSNCNNGVANCITCLQNGPCLGCAEGFLLSNTTGTPACITAPSPSTCLVDNCLQCESGNPKQCSKCASPYNVSNGICVCGFQNCLSCKQTALSCDTCPSPLFSSIQTGGCIPAPSLNHNCSVPNCDQCLTINQCSICAVGYQLNPTNMSCMLVNCSALGLSNCQLCDPYGSSCHLCQTGYMMNSIEYGGSCYPINPNYTCNIAGCAVCSSTNNSICASCLPTFYANSSTQCLPNTCSMSNCYICLQNNVCSVCLAGYYLAVNMTCQPMYSNLANCQGQIPFCAMCVVNYANSNNQKYCVKCQDGFQFDSSNSACIPQVNPISNCKVKMSWGSNTQPICQICQQGYFLNSFGSCSPYNPSKNNTGCSVSNCLYCGLNSTQCSFCLSPWGISSTGQCLDTVNCPSNCQFCLNSTYCLTCNAGYTVSTTNNLCVQCSVTGCQQCNQANVCASCNVGYTLTSSGICLACSVLYCKSCSSANYCQTCNSVNGTQLSPSPTGGSCYACNTSLPNMGSCLSCNATNSCGLCQNGYQLYIPTNSTGVCIQCTIQNCQSCKLNGSNVVCAACAYGYSAIGNSCVQCLYPCATCTANQGPNNCATCAIPYYFATALSTGACVVNTIPNCMSYNTTNTSLCATCATGYKYNSTTNTCYFNCPANCQQCTSSSNCTQCLTGFYLTGSSPNVTCAMCQVSGCSACSGSGSTCTQCATGFYLKQQECIACPGYCSSCTGNNTCQSLVQSKQQVLMQVGTQTLLAVCSANCQVCSNVNPEICLTCQSGFYLKNGNCFKCNSNCLTCNNSNPNQCLTCYPNNFISGSTCVTCNSSCLTCAGFSQQSKCLSCNDGYYLSNNTCIQGCPLNCLTCSSSGTCTQCLSGYTLFKQSGNVVCAPCTTLCRTCAQGQPAACLSCGAGFYLSGNTCVQCSINCQTCSATGCSACVSGYFLTSAQTCSQNCQLPCSTCSAINPAKCTNCIAGYSYNDVSNVCNQILSCSGGCSVCPLGYSLNQGQCTACTTSQCQTCDPVNPGLCYSCLPGFYLNSNSQCSSCPASCATCLTGSGCLTCASGYTTLVDVPATSNGYQCIACNFPCATCLNTPDYCTSCVDGYEFFGWKCAQSFYFGFDLTLLTTLATFNQNYYNFILALTGAIKGSNPNAITITSITQGSVLVSGGAGPSGGSGSQQAYNEYSSLGSALSANSQIAGMTIGQSTVSVVGGSVNYKQVNLALILGICIPVGVLLIAGIVLYIYCKKRKSSDVIEQKIKQDSGFTVRESFQLSSRYREEETRRPFQNTTAIN